jgi:hypothetical protein
MDDTKIRSLLYEGSGLAPLFNPMAAQEVGAQPLVIDMTLDIATHTRLYHDHTDDVRDLLGQAAAVVCDTERMARVARKFTKGLVVVTPFGHTTARDRESDAFTIGLLNATEEQQVVNKSLRKFCKALKQPLLVYGEALDWTENGDNQVMTDFDLFASTVDLLLLIGTDHVIPQLSLPLSVMLSGAVVLGTGHYNPLSPASGVLILPELSAKLWTTHIHKFEQNLRRLDSLKKFNSNYARQISRESQNLIYRLAHRVGNKKR